MDIGLVEYYVCWFPRTLVHLKFNDIFNWPTASLKTLEKGMLPALTYLELGWDYKQIIQKEVLPDSLKYLDLVTSRFLRESSLKKIVF